MWQRSLLATVLACLAHATIGPNHAAAVAPEDRPTRRAPRPAPKVGDVAPPFALKSVDGKREVSLADFAGKRPVVLFFGSYT